MIILSLAKLHIFPTKQPSISKKMQKLPQISTLSLLFPFIFDKKPPFLFSFSLLFCLFSFLFFLSFTSSPSPSFLFSSPAICGGACLVTVQSDSVALPPRLSFPPFLPSKTPSSLRFLPAKLPKTG